MIPHAGPYSHRELPVRRLWFCTSRVAATPPHLTCCLALPVWYLAPEYPLSSPTIAQVAGEVVS